MSLAAMIALALYSLGFVMSVAYDDEQKGPNGWPVHLFWPLLIALSSIGALMAYIEDRLRPPV